ncbi:MAG: CCA tRNA nucleotidyltransferase [Deltaproteobacteria bacterium]|nr:CCA tRNA nucleotidyltransferase [Deltaproteobacteria bacterium]
MVEPYGIPVPKETSFRVLRALRRRKALWRFLESFCRAAAAAGGSTYLVGGFVRDLIEGCPGKDVDLMVTGVQFGPLGRALGSLPAADLGIRRILQAGRQFAVYKVSAAWSEEDIDIALARTEHSTGPGHRQFDVRTDGIDAREDASRRDFTINSLIFRFLFAGNRLSGEVIDFFGGLEDLRRKRIRGVGNPAERYREDPLRMLRAIRQKNERKGYFIEKRTWDAIRKAAPQLLGTISGERVIGELLRSLAANPEGTVRDLHRAGILRILFPGAPGRKGYSPPRMERRYAIMERSLGRPLPETLLLANLLVEFAEAECRNLAQGGAPWSSRRGRADRPGPTVRRVFRLPQTEAAARRLHFPQVRRVVQLLEDLGRLAHGLPARNRNARIESIFGRWESPRHLQVLYDAVRESAGRRKTDFGPILRKAARLKPLLSGRDLLAIGIPAGPRMEEILEEVREATLAGRVGTEEEAENLVRRIFLKGRAAPGPLLVQPSRRANSSVRRNPSTARTRGT